MQHLGKKLKSLIEWKGESKVAVSKGSGVPLSTLNKQFTLSIPDLGVIIAVLDYLQMDLSAMFDNNITPLEADILGEARRLPSAKKEAVLKGVLATLKGVNG